MKKIILSLLCLYTSILSAWEWGDTYEQAKERSIPFGFFALEPHIRQVCSYGGIQSHMISYDFPLTRQHDHYKGYDPNLDLRVRFSINEDKSPIQCVVMKEDRPYFCMEIWYFKWWPTKHVYVVNFADTKSRLIITNGKKKEFTAQWAYFPSLN